jgi:hypothetical protein
MYLGLDLVERARIREETRVLGVGANARRQNKRHRANKSQQAIRQMIIARRYRHRNLADAERRAMNAAQRMPTSSILKTINNIRRILNQRFIVILK